ncbi:MupA/Atu3671 family FMN-dependent luciferase-like monooxygenase [Jidongwangia harbinensis]|uniref:MupA/Atu3671 family FMN-dependent luciferase-like monooxygenase n=1 Tax=Jidongwangia harbinensis TaxID=2878561 RepID=UPI001CD98C92|nr:MupA/Atu3671 family FMN-dependent luciferase-like monooxygenase [Jidongwangia harbinensis]MCA2211608.1 LLM class flavin-dependent oxidoreductase [Jidongwangia harbinensis]
MTTGHLDDRARLAARLRALAEPARPLSYAQRRLWFLDQLVPGSAVYNVPLGFRIRGPLDVTALDAALSTVVRRHELLRTVFPAPDGEPVPRVLDAGVPSLTLVDLAAEPDPAAAVRAAAATAARQPFDLVSGPLWRAVVFRTGPADHLFTFTAHHIVADGWSAELLGREISECYAAHLARRPPQLPELTWQYDDYARWQEERLRRDGAGSLDYWRAALADVPELAALPTDHPRPPVLGYDGSAIAVALPDGASARVAELARSTGSTPYSVLLAAFAVLVSRCTGDERVVIGTPVANRDQHRTAPLIGFFTNTLALRVDVPAGESFAALVARVGGVVRAALAHQDVPFEWLVEQLRPERDLARNPLFDVLFSYRTDEVTAWRLPGCEVTAEPGETGAARFDLTLSLVDGAHGCGGRLEYRTDLFDAGTAGDLGRRFSTVLGAALDAPGAPVGDLPVLAPEEASRLARWSGRDATAPGVPDTVDRRISRRVAERPAAVALRDADGAWTYAELWAAAGTVAARLRALGAGPGSRIGVHLPRTRWLVAALLGVLRAGAAYVPLDPAYPAARLRLVAADAGLLAVLTDGPRLPMAAGLAPHALDVTGPAGPAAGPEPVVGPDDLAYLMYTSGSTGRPKGVAVSHGNLAAFAGGMDALLGDGPDREQPTWLAVTSVSFDISVLELLWTLTRGHRVAIGDPAAAGARAVRRTDLSVFFFGSDSAAAHAGDRYRLLRTAARFADRHGFAAVWTPERHFHAFGGLFPNPAVTGAALAAWTERVDIRAGSVVLPLHDPLEVAEQWAAVDNLSGGRVGVSFASGWHARDFVLAPDRFADRKRVMVDGIEEVRRLWRGGTVTRRSGDGTPVEVGVHPRPVRADLPCWLTSARHPDTFRAAGELGAGLLTHLLGHDLAELADKIMAYRQAWRAAGHGPHARSGRDGHVVVMLHTFVGPDRDQARGTAREPLRAYLRTSLDLVAGLGGAAGADLRALPPEDLEPLIDRAVDRFTATAGLLGTPDDAAAMIERLAGIGVDEVACLLDFGVAEPEVIAGLEHLARVPAALERRAAAVHPVSDQLRRYGATHLQCTPSLARLVLAEDGGPAALGGLRRMLLGGEALGADLAGRVRSAVPEVHNMYGPTEATIWATSAPVDGGAIRIGRPLPGARAYVADARLRLAPVGVPGELLLGGDYVARGYHGRPGLTADRFVPDPFGERPGARLYRTGDLVRWRHDGMLEYLGRLDDQVKIRGHRVELGEVEAALAAHPAVEAAVAAVRGTGAERMLVGYAVPRPGTPMPAAEALREFLADRLPEAMIPATFGRLDELPLTPNGKVDRRRLPEPGTGAADRPHEPPVGPTEELVAGVWRELLPVDAVGRSDSFFALGGNSLLVVRARARLIAATGVDVTLLDLFRYPTVAALAAVLDARRHDPGHPPGGPAQVATEAAADGARRRAALARSAHPRRTGRAG